MTKSKKQKKEETCLLCKRSYARIQCGAILEGRNAIMCVWFVQIMENIVAKELTEALTGLNNQENNEPPESRRKYKTILLVCAALLMLGQGCKEILSSTLLFDAVNNYINSTRHDHCTL